MTDQSKPRIDRRTLLKGALGAGVASGLVSPMADAQDGPVAKNGRINQSMVFWCYQNYWGIEDMCKVAKRLGIKSIELVEVKDWPILKQHGLSCALANSHWFDEGMNNPKHQPMCLQKMRDAIDACAAHHFPNVITFTGFAGDISPEDGIRNCISGYKQIVGEAEQKGVTLCLEMLNTRDKEEMKGHPGYQGDHTEYVMEIIKGVSSPSLKLLFDVYHVQIMDGDVMRRIDQYAEYIGHYHTAGNPGRNEIGDTQEINYPPIMKKIVSTGYAGYVAQEFLPTGDAYAGLAEAVRLCDV